MAVKSQKSANMHFNEDTIPAVTAVTAPVKRERLLCKNMELRRFKQEDWNEIKNIYNLSKPDEIRGSVDLRALIPIEKDEKGLILFNESEILVVEENKIILGFGGHKGNYISWLFIHPSHRRRGIAHMILDQLLSQLIGTIKLNVGKNNRDLGTRRI